jgi:hypothetical protein
MPESDPPPHREERRARPEFRALIDEMLLQLRAASGQSGVWTPESRARAEADLARIMDSVRQQAVDGAD